MSSSKTSYKPHLDGLRAISILLVLLFHYVSRDLHPYTVHWNGWCGVQIFFVISGYLISTLLLEELEQNGRVSFWRFYARRALRILPVYLTYLTIAHYLVAPSPRSFSAGLLFMTEYDLVLRGRAAVPDQYALLWSLAVEEKFYLFAPLLLTFIPRRRLFPVFLAIFVTLEFWKCLVLLTNPRFDRIYFAFDTQIDAIVIGILAALVQKEPWARQLLTRFATPPFLVVLAIYFIMTSLGGYNAPSLYLKALHYGIHLPVFCMAIAYFILMLETTHNSLVAGILASRPLVFVGKLSYSIYIWHTAIIIALQSSKTQNSEIGYIFSDSLAVVNLIVIFAVSACSYYCLERPFVLLRKRLTGRRKLQGHPKNESSGVVSAV